MGEESRGECASVEGLESNREIVTLFVVTTREAKRSRDEIKGEMMMRVKAMRFRY